MQASLSPSDLVELPVRLLQGDPLLPYWDVLYSVTGTAAVIAGCLIAFFSMGRSAMNMLISLSVAGAAFGAGYVALSSSLPEEWVLANGRDAARVRHAMTGKPVAPDELTRTDVMKSVKWLEAERREIELATHRMAVNGATPEQIEAAIDRMLATRRRGR